LIQRLPWRRERGWRGCGPSRAAAERGRSRGASGVCVWGLPGAIFIGSCGSLGFGRPRGPSAGGARELGCLDAWPTRPRALARTRTGAGDGWFATSLAKSFLSFFFLISFSLVLFSSFSFRSLIVYIEFITFVKIISILLDTVEQCSSPAST
jgi:hypothetical protein